MSELSTRPLNGATAPNVERSSTGALVRWGSVRCYAQELWVLLRSITFTGLPATSVSITRCFLRILLGVRSRCS